MTDVEEDPRAALTSTADGRVAIPARIRRAAAIEPGQTLIVYVENGRIVMEERQRLIERLRSETTTVLRASGYAGEATDAPIEDRRREAEAEREGSQ